MENHNNPNNSDDHGIYEGYIPPTIAAEKHKPLSKPALIALWILPGLIVIGAVIALFVGLYSCITGGFRAKNLEVEVNHNPPRWYVCGREINGTAAKEFTGYVFYIIVDGEGSLDIKVTDVDGDETFADMLALTSGTYYVDVNGEKARFEVTAHDFSGKFHIHEEYS